MAELVWDQVGERFFESGVDKAVFYSPNHLVEVEDVEYPKGFAWNGLVSVDVRPENLSVSPLYYDGKKIFDLVQEGDFAANMKAFTYPDEFVEFDGFAEMVEGMLFDNQPRGTFGLCYRTKIGNDLNQDDLGYKIHVLYNLTAVPDDLSYQTVGSNVDPIEFSWNLTAVPETIPGYRPSAHIVLDSTKINSGILEELEAILYGTEDTDARLPTIEELIFNVTVVVTDNGDGTFTVTGPDHLVSMIGDSDIFSIEGVNVVYLNSYTYEISSP